MHDAFNIKPVLKQLPVQIESVATYGDRLLLGTANGALLVYRVVEPTKEHPLSITLVDTKKGFARKGIERLEVIKEAGILVCLADGLVALYDLHTLGEPTPLNNTKGASVISVHTSVDHIDNIPTLVSKLAVYAKRKVAVFEWRDAEFYKSFEYPSSDKITAIQFASSDIMALCTAKEFLTLQLPEGQWDDLFPADASSLRTVAGTFGGGGIGSSSQLQSSSPGNHNASSVPGNTSMWGSWAIGLSGSNSGPKAMIARMPGERLLLCYENVGVFINSAGKVCSLEFPEPIIFDQKPLGITFTSSYVLTIASSQSENNSLSNLPSSKHPKRRANVEVRNIGTQALVQMLLLPDEEPTLIVNGMGGKQVWVIGPHSVWRLMPTPIQQQVEDVLAAGQYDEAMSLVAQFDNILEDEKIELTQKIRWLRARWLFREHGRYNEALEEFSDLGATPTEVIALCPKKISGELAEVDSDSESECELESNKTQNTKNDNDQIKTTRPNKVNKDQRHAFWRNSFFALMPYLTEHRRFLQNAISKKEQNLEYLVCVFDDNEDYSNNASNCTEDDTDSISISGAADMNNHNKIRNATPNERDDEAEDSLPHVRLKRLHFSLEMVEIQVAAMAQVIDTTLLRIYLECSPGLLGPLLRVKNYCDVEESERLLLENHKYHELVELYHGKGLYRNALQLLKSQGQALDSGRLTGTYPTAQYLSRLPPDQFELILEYIKWPLKNEHISEYYEQYFSKKYTSVSEYNGNFESDIGVWPQPPYVVSTVFADDRPSSEQFPRVRLAIFLRQFSPKLSIQYLSYVFKTWDDTTPFLHDEMVSGYLDIISGIDDRLLVDGDESPNLEIRDLRHELQQFLKNSKWYSPEKALAKLPDDSLYEERALILSRLGRHRHALQLLVFSVANLKIAEKYCVENIGACSDIFTMLVDILILDPPEDIVDNEAIKLQREEYIISDDSRSLEYQTKQNRRKIHQKFIGDLLLSHRQCIDVAQILNLLPKDVSISYNICEYLKFQMCTMEQNVRSTNIVRNLHRGEDTQARRFICALQSKNVVITETRTCPHCLKRIGAGTAFAVIPQVKNPLGDPSVVHYSCWQRCRIEPIHTDPSSPSRTDREADSDSDSDTDNESTFEELSNAKTSSKVVLKWKGKLIK